MDVAAILLTGGASRRLGRDKATLLVGPYAPGSGVTLARLGADRLRGVALPGLVVEVGRGVAGADHVTMEDPAGAGPLAAVAAGTTALSDLGWSGPVLVVAVDLPRLRPELLTWLAGHPGDASVIPLVYGRLQPLCARWSATALTRAAGLVAAGERSMRALLDADPGHVETESWADVVDATTFADIDTPDDMSLLGTFMHRNAVGEAGSDQR